ncbi:MAG: iron-sulfur cluster assembly scaffold protein [Candidatus Nanoarchaeia archaeon]
MDDLYRQELLELYRNPKNKGIMLNPHIHTDDSNPLCGDQVEIFVRLDKEGKVKEAMFEGKGCVISIASASLLTDYIKGKTLKEIEYITREDLLDLIGINLSPSRIKCAVLPLATLKKGILSQKEKESSKSTKPKKEEERKTTKANKK